MCETWDLARRTMVVVSVSCPGVSWPWPVSRSVIPNRWWILTNRWQTPAPGDHGDLISELLSTQRGRRDTNIIPATWGPSPRAACVVCAPHQGKCSPPTFWSSSILSVSHLESNRINKWLSVCVMCVMFTQFYFASWARWLSYLANNLNQNS